MKTKEQQAEEYAMGRAKLLCPMDANSIHTLHGTKEDYKEVFLAGYDAAVKDMGWRNAKTDPPKEKEIVITLSSSGAVGRSYLKKGVWRMVDYISHSDGDYVTHWMPIVPPTNIKED